MPLTRHLSFPLASFLLLFTASSVFAMSMEDQAIQLRQEAKTLVKKVRQYEDGSINRKQVKQQIKVMRNTLAMLESSAGVKSKEKSTKNSIKKWDGRYTVRAVSPRTSSWGKRTRRSIAIDTSQPLVGLELYAQTASYRSSDFYDLEVEFNNGKKLIINGEIGRVNGMRNEGDMLLKLADFKSPRRVKQVTLYTSQKLDWVQMRGKVPRSYIQ
ncbi:hypothetical protein [Kistimonas asteriae]|uniref:hypothetical protein n=1 Tax=Kistimonas asteriae TaxID=517724 RepID=UPI001BA4A4A5|nr:hypothetical protein [Kistimonas asteriae]